MSRATPDDQLKFLLSCVRYSNNGKIDFVEVARECSVVSKGAAAKRYERLLKANGIHPSGGPTESNRPSGPAVKQRSKTNIAKSADAKRRKIEGDTYNIKMDQDDDFMPFLKPEPLDFTSIKSEPDSVFQPYVYPHIPVSATQQFLPRPNAMIQRAYTPMLPSRPMTPHFQAPPSTSVFNPIPQQAPFPVSNIPAMSQNQMTPLLQSSTPLPEEFINSGFSDFCGHDLLKRPDFGSTMSSHSAVPFPDASIVNQSEAPSHTDECTLHDTHSLNNHHSEPQQEPELASGMSVSPAPVIDDRMGRGINDSILIMD